MKRNKYSKFSGERRMQFIVECLENSLTSEEVFQANEQELRTYGIEDAGTLHQLLYSKSSRPLEDLNLYISKKDKLQKMSEKERSKVEKFMQTTYGALGFNYQNRSTPYETIKRGTSAPTNLKGMFNSLGLSDL